MAGLVQLELDSDDKKSFAEMQQNMGQAQQELAMIGNKMRVREQVRVLVPQPATFPRLAMTEIAQPSSPSVLSARACWLAGEAHL